MFKTTECKLGAVRNMHEYAQIQQYYHEKCKMNHYDHSFNLYGTVHAVKVTPFPYANNGAF